MIILAFVPGDPDIRRLRKVQQATILSSERPLRKGALVAWLLAHVADSHPRGGDAPLRSGDVAILLEAGLGPLLRHALGDDGRLRLPAEVRQRLDAAELTTKLRHCDYVEAAMACIAACQEVGVLPVLLKGISTSSEVYSRPHLRPMTDVDVLLPAGAYRAVEARLLEAGYVHTGQASPHHGVPLRHPRGGMWVELHTDLLPPSARLVGEAFSLDHVQAELRASTFEGQRVLRLTPELQIPYIAASVMIDVIHFGPHPSFLCSFVDLILLLDRFGPVLDWGRLDRSLDTPMARATTFVALSYLARSGFAAIPSFALDALAKGQRWTGRFHAATIHLMLDRYLLSGRHWDLPFPPPVPARYSLRFQYEKRIAPWLRGRAAG